MAGVTSGAPSEDDQLLQRQRHYYGRAKVGLANLVFEGENVPGGRIFEQKNVTRLLHIFETEGCCRLNEPEHYITVLVNPLVLEHSLQRSNLEAATLLNPAQHPQRLNLNGDESLIVLDGKHRADAGRKFLAPFDQWWVVELYSTELPSSCILELRTKDLNARGYTDGDIFRHLRYSEFSRDSRQAKKWEAKLSQSKLNDIKVLRRKHASPIRDLDGIGFGGLDDVSNTRERFRSLSEAFDGLIDFTGLWGALQLGTFHRILTLNCDEVCLKETFIMVQC